jgi:hypothetical protein
MEKDIRQLARLRPPMKEGAGVDSRVTNPLEELLKVAEEALLWKDELKRRVVALHEDEWRYETKGMGEQIRAEIQLYERSIDRLARILVMIAKLGIEERLTRVTERQALLIEKAVALAIEETHLPAPAQDRLRESVARHLKAVS